jgi:PAS domain S-box-containing protein
MLSTIEGQAFDLEWASSYRTGLEALLRAAHDVCLLDYKIDNSDGLELLRESRTSGCKAPVIVLTGIGDYRLDVEAMQIGAADFLVKDQLTATLLERSIRYAIAQARTLEELRRQQEEIRASELRFRSVVQSASDAIVQADENAQIIFWNKAAETIFGYREEEVLGLPLELLMTECHRPALRLGLERFRTGGKSQLVGRTSELEGLRKDGSEFPLELSLASWTTGEGTSFTAIIRDITERKHAEEMRYAKEAAEEANRTKSGFVAKISHDLRTPLHAIIGFTNIVLRSDALDRRNLDFLERILLNAKDQLRLINSLLDLSKVEAGRMDVELTFVSLDTLVNEVVSQFEGERRNPDVRILLDVPPLLPAVFTDPAKLKQVLINLIDNALKFTKRGTVTVNVATSPVDDTPVRIDVIDTGPGIPPNRLEEIFEPFRQLEGEAGRVGAGSGLGLSISRTLCELLGYSLQVRSRPDRGSTFSILMPTSASVRTMPCAAESSWPSAR